jgi:hypothetical protein
MAVLLVECYSVQRGRALMANLRNVADTTTHHQVGQLSICPSLMLMQELINDQQ